MKKLFAFLLFLLPWPALAQIGPVGAISINVTSVTGGTNGDCLTISNGKLGQTAACGGASGLTVGTSTITGGTTTRILYDNAGVLGEYTLSGSGTVVAMAVSPSFTTPALGVATGTSLAVNGATIGSNALAVLGPTSLGNGATTIAANGDMVLNTGLHTNSTAQNWGAAGLFLTRNDGVFGWSATTTITGTGDTGLSRGGSAAVVAVGNGSAGDFSGTIKATNWNSGGTAGVTCAGPPTAGFASTNGIVTHC